MAFAIFLFCFKQFCSVDSPFFGLGNISSEDLPSDWSKVLLSLACGSAVCKPKLDHSCLASTLCFCPVSILQCLKVPKRTYKINQFTFLNQLAEGSQVLCPLKFSSREWRMYYMEPGQFNWFKPDKIVKVTF